MTAPTVQLVPHTQSDREWYEPFRRFTSVRRRAGELEVRVVAEPDRDTTAVLSGPFRSGVRVDLLGRPGSPIEVDTNAGAGCIALPLRPWRSRPSG